jgi:hypothetical protein
MAAVGADVRRALISSSPSGPVARTPTTRPSSSMRPVASVFMASENEGSFFASSDRKSRKSHCGISTTKG